MQRQFNPYVRYQRSLKLTEKKMIIFSYYGSLTRFIRPVLSKADVAKKLRMAPSTVSLNIRRFIAGGHSFDAMQAKKKSFLKVPARL